MIPKNYKFSENDYWNLRKQALLHLSVSEYEKVIRFGQKYGFTKAKFDLTLDLTLQHIYNQCDRDERYLFQHEDAGNLIANDEVYPFLEELFQHDDFSPFEFYWSGKRYSEYYKFPQVHDSPLYYVAMQGDRRMMEFLLSRVDCHAAYHQGLYDAVLKHYLYIKLPDWGDLANVTGSQDDLLTAVEKQAEKIHAAPSPVLRSLLKAGFPSAYTRLPLEYSDVQIIQEEDRNYHFVADHVDVSTSPRGNGSLGYAHNDKDMVRALSESGEFYPFTCECGEEGCAGLWEGIQCLNTPTGMRWYKPYPLPMSCIVFDPIPALESLEKALVSLVKRLEPEWGTEEKMHDDCSFPHGPFGSSFYLLKKDLEFCRKRLNEVKGKGVYYAEK